MVSLIDSVDILEISWAELQVMNYDEATKSIDAKLWEQEVEMTKKQ